MVISESIIAMSRIGGGFSFGFCFDFCFDIELALTRLRLRLTNHTMISSTTTLGTQFIEQLLHSHPPTEFASSA
jgi:hypothetical protein